MTGEDLIFHARIAEQAERYFDMVQFMRTYVYV